MDQIEPTLLRRLFFVRDLSFMRRADGVLLSRTWPRECSVQFHF